MTMFHVMLSSVQVACVPLSLTSKGVYHIWVLLHHITLMNVGIVLISPKEALKCVLLHNGNLCSSMLIVYSVTDEENYEGIQKVLKLKHYDDNKKIICADMEIVS